MKEKKQDKSTSAFGRLMEYAGRFKTLTYLSLILSALSSVLALLPFVCIWRIIREVLEVQPDFSRATGIVRNGWMAVLFAVLAWLVYVGALVCSHGSAFRTAANMKKTLMRHIARLPIGFADEMGSGKVRRTVTEVTGSTETLLAHNLPDMAGAITMPVCMVVMLFLYDWRYGVACLISVVLSFAVMMRMAGPAMQEDMRQYQNALERMSNEAVEYVRGIPVVKTFGQTVFSFHRFKASIDDYRDFCMHYTRMMRSSMLNLLTVPVERMNEITDCPAQTGTTDFHPKGYDICFENVGFSYDKDKTVLKDVTFTAKQGQVTALVGPSGGGKTTVSRLAARFWDVSKGRITVGGQDISKIDPETLLSVYSIVFQDVTLFNNSILENIRVGKKDATDDEVLAAAKLANCDEFALKLPQGYATVIGENGSELSGDERQRISIARAFLKDAPIILLDEASASLDVENETVIQEALSRLIRNKTVMVIAHRMRTVSGADKIVVLSDGTIAEEGSPEELLSQEDSMFRRMAQLQTASAAWSIHNR